MNVRGKVQVSPLGDTVDIGVFIPLPYTQKPPEARGRIAPLSIAESPAGISTQLQQS